MPAKVNSNLAAALSKLAKYDDAYEAAKAATKVDPQWSKAHWRLGTVLELQKDFLNATCSYERAVELEPEVPVYKKAFKRMLGRLGCETKDGGDGKVWTVGLPVTSKHRSDTEPPCMVVWNRIMKKTNNLEDMEQSFPEYSDGKITSEQWLGQALYYWHGAMQRQLGELANGTEMGSKLEELKRQMARGNMSKVEFDTKRLQLTGVPPTQGTEFSDMLNALTYTAGEQIPLESQPARLVPSPPWLEGYRHQQATAVHMVVYYSLLNCRHTLSGTDFGNTDWTGGEDLVLSQAICNSARSFLANAGQNGNAVPEEGVSPEDAVEFIKKKLREGKTWELGVRKYVSFLYRGTVLAAWQSRLMVGLGVALKDLKWANKFIKLADKEWKVTENESYETHGVTFRKSFQVNILLMEMVTAFTIRNHVKPKLEELVYEFDLAQEIITIAKQQLPPTSNTFNGWMFYTVFSRKPLAYCCSHLAGTMNTMKSYPQLFIEAIERSGMADPNREDNLMTLITETSAFDSVELNMNALIAETYKLAAMAQLHDDKETSILWWGYASHICHAGGGYTMGNLRYGINKAAIAAQEMDPLFGPSKWKGSIYQKEAMLLAMYFQDEKDDFVFPPLDIERRPDGNLAVFVAGQVLCMNFDRHVEMHKKKLEDKEKDAYFDTTEVEKELDGL